MILLLTCYVFFINLVAFVSVVSDKKRAKKEKWRIPESRLWGLAFFGGALGLWCAMKAYRHKTKHHRFMFGVPILCFVNIALYVLIFR